MSQVLEVSAGYPVEGRPFEPPQLSRQNEQPRYITFVGSLVEAGVALDRPWTKGGGIEIGNPCLRYTKNFVRKGRITPVLKDVHDWVTQDYWEKATGRDASYFPRQVPAGYVSPLNESGHPSPIRAMYGKIAVPGEQMDSILNGSANILDRTRRGVVELTELVGHDYNPQDLGDGIVTDPTVWKIQRTILPDYPFIMKDGQPTVLLDDIEEVLLDAQRHTSLRSIVDKYLTSLNQFRDFAKGSVDQTHYRMKESAVKSDSGYIWKYTELDFVLMEQLGVARQDREIRQANKTQPNERLENMFEQWLAIQIEEKQANLERQKQFTVDQNTMAAAPIQDKGFDGASGYSGYSGEVVTNVTAQGQEEIAVAMADTMHTCECGKEFDTSQGISMHKARWCELLKTPDAESTQSEA